MIAPPPLDAKLWAAIENELIALNDNDIEEISDMCFDEGPDDTPLRDEGGRNVNSLGMIYDVIHLDSRWELWFALLEEEGRDAISAEIDETLRDSGAWEAGRDYDWAAIDWSVLGRMIGAAILLIGFRDNWVFRRHDGEIQDSSDIWRQLEDEMRQLGIDVDSALPNAAALDALASLIQHNIDPLADIGRAADGPAKPLTNEGSFIRVNSNVERVRERIRILNLSRGGGGGGGPPAEDILGELCLEVINEALDELAKGNYIEFALRIHGLTGYMAVRRKSVVQKVGMHLIASIFVRKEIRGVGGLLAPDIANNLNTQFSIGKALKVMRKYGIISWSAVPVTTVNAALDA
jgi:hypothetical protein